MRVRTVLLALAVGLAALSGCQKLTYEKTYTIPGGETEEFTIDAPRYDQKVTVSVSPSKGPVSAWLVKASGLEKARQAVQRKKEPPEELVLGKQLSTTKADLSFEATVPAKTEYSLLMKNAGSEASEVTVKVVGR